MGENSGMRSLVHVLNTRENPLERERERDRERMGETLNRER